MNYDYPLIHRVSNANFHHATLMASAAGPGAFVSGHHVEQWSALRQSDRLVGIHALPAPPGHDEGQWVAKHREAIHDNMPAVIKADERRKAQLEQKPTYRQAREVKTETTRLEKQAQIRLVGELHAAGRSPAEIAKQAGIPLRTVYRRRDQWLKQKEK